ncbi:MAG: gliding motility-associated ABC transporter substrate-binding protein GldG [Bacteroidota bacterium]|nr:gliding motility-associated ABC transporter substrate-binding protein GldG [Bacteroidota bacterium]
MKKHHKKNLFINILLIISINLTAYFFYFRFDLTEEKKYSINPTTKKLLTSLDDITYIKVYLDGDLPAGFIRLKNTTIDLLEEYRNLSQFIEYEFINPNELNTDTEKKQLYRELSENGLEATNLQIQGKNSNSEQLIFPGAIIFYKGKSISLNLLQNQIGTDPQTVLNNSIENAEFEFTNALFKLTKDYKPKIAFLQGHNELDELQTADIHHSLGNNRGSLSEYFQVEHINIRDYEVYSNQGPSLEKQLNRLNRYKALIIAKPSRSFSEVDKFLIDQFIMNGGKTLWLIDGVVMDMDSLKGKRSYTMAIPNDLNLSDMLFRYGVRINYDLIMDFQSDKIPVVVGYQGDIPQQQLLPWLYSPIVIPKNKHTIVKNIDGIKSMFASSMDTIRVANVKKTPLLFSSPYSKLPKAPHRVSLNILQQEPSLDQYNNGKIPLAYLLEGEFESVFKNRLAPSGDNFAVKTKSNSNKMIVIGDGDIIKNHVNSSNQAYPLGYNHYSKTQYNGNKQLIINALNYMLGNEGLIDIRSKEISLRLLNKKEAVENKLRWQLINLIIPIFLVSLSITLILQIRKRKFG